MNAMCYVLKCLFDYTRLFGKYNQYVLYVLSNKALYDSLGRIELDD